MRPPLILLTASFLLSLVMHWSILGTDIQGMHNWRQSQTMWNVRNFARYDNNILNTRVSHFNGSNDNLYRYEFPVMQWGIAQVIRLTGWEEVTVARVLVWLVGVVGVLGFFLLLRCMAFTPLVVAAGAVLYQFAPLFYFYTVNVLPDLLALAAAVWYVYLSFAYFRDRGWGQAVGAAACLGLATLAKLPYAMFGIVGAVFFVGELFRRGRSWGRLAGFAAVHVLMLVPAFLWYRWVMPGWGGNPILAGVFGNAGDWAGNMAILRHHLTDTFPYALLSPSVWLFFLLGTVWPARRAAAPLGYRRYVWALAGITFVYLILQWTPIGIVHDYYLLPFLPWMYIVVTGGLGRIGEWALGGERGMQWLWVGLVTLAVATAPVVAHRLYSYKWDAQVGYFHWADLRDAYTHREALRAAVPDDDTFVVALNDPSFHVFTWLIRKRGYVLSHSKVPPEWLVDMMNRGATHLYSTSREADQAPEIQPFLDSLLLEAGQVHVYKLKQPEG